MKEAFRRTEVLLGSAKMKKLQESSIAIIGLGGVGSYAAEAMARCGTGSILLVDHDRIEASNINRQLPALHSTLGRYKTDVVAARLLDINPALTVAKHTVTFNRRSSEEILSPQLDYVIDAIDSLPDKVHLIKSCLEKNIPVISSMGAARRLNPLLLKVADIKDTSVCPLARRLRRELHKEEIYTGFKVVFSLEPPLKPAPGESGELGSIATVPASAGLLLASVVINDLLAQ
jgi:tRNA A37 threonylcarbamoyladenosine dehydratase